MITYTFVALFCLMADAKSCIEATAGPEIVPADMSVQQCYLLGQQIAAVMLKETDTMINGKGPYIFRSYQCRAGRDA